MNKSCGLCIEYVKKKKIQDNINQTKSIKISPPKTPRRHPKSNETKIKTMWERKDEVIFCDKRKITKAHVIYALSRLN